MADAFDEVLGWVRSAEPGSLVPAEWVPGASSIELGRLANLGGLAREAIGDNAPGTQLPSDVALWLERGATPGQPTIEQLQQLLSRSGEQTWARLYSEAIGARSRRRLGTYFTPASEVAWMLDISAGLIKPATVVDVGAGVGAFTMAAATQWPDSKIVAVDINPVTLGLLAVESIRLGMGHQVELVQDDYADWVFGKLAELDPGPRLFLGNPPYTRLQLLPPSQRLTSHLKSRLGSLQIGARSSLSTIFTASTLSVLRPTDVLCFLLPTYWLDSAHSVDLRNWLWQSSKRAVAMHLFPSDTFSDARVDAVALVVGPVEASRPALKLSSGVPGPNAAVKTVARAGSGPGSWRALFDESVKKVEKPTPDRTSRALSDYARVSRGTATGANDFFVLDRQQIRNLELSRSVLRPLLRRLNVLSPEIERIEKASEVPLDQRRWLIAARDEKALKGHLELGVNRDLPARVLMTKRRVWFDLSNEIRVPDVIVTQSTRSRFRFVANDAGIAILNNLQGIWWTDKELVASQRAAILSWLRSDNGQAALRRVAKRHGDGLLKLEPGALSRIHIPGSVWDSGAT